MFQEGSVVIREDRELLAELAQLNGDMTSLGLRIMEGSASAREQQDYAERLIAAGERLKRRAGAIGGTVIEGEVCAEEPIALPGHTAGCSAEPVELDWEP
ncbi:MAG: hypothetical protein ACRDT0_10595 [Pseudonocardiaceae bacterium]